MWGVSSLIAMKKVWVPWETDRHLQLYWLPSQPSQPSVIGSAVSHRSGQSHGSSQFQACSCWVQPQGSRPGRQRDRAPHLWKPGQLRSALTWDHRLSWPFDHSWRLSGARVELSPWSGSYWVDLKDGHVPRVIVESKARFQGGNQSHVRVV